MNPPDEKKILWDNAGLIHKAVKAIANAGEISNLEEALDKLIAQHSLTAAIHAIVAGERELSEFASLEESEKIIIAAILRSIASRNLDPVVESKDAMALISDNDVLKIFQDSKKLLINYTHDGVLPCQFHRGVGLLSWEGQHRDGCKRHLTLFSKLNIIPEYCFGCYKVLIEVGTVVELFKLMVVLEQVKLPWDNSRKCFTEGRPDAGGFYKGLIYCRGIKEARNIRELIAATVSQRISSQVSVTIKHGCSSYGLAHPEYEKLEPDMAVLTGGANWRAQEALAEKNNVAGKQPVPPHSYNHSTYVLEDALIMQHWLHYAATVGDSSYLFFSGAPVPAFRGLTRPVPFVPPM